MKRALWWIWRQSRLVRPALVCSLVAGVLRIAASLGFVWVSKSLVDMATRRPVAPVSDIVTGAVVLVAVMFAEMGLSLLYSYLCSKSEIKLKNKLRHDLYESVLGADFARVRTMHSGEVVNSLIEDTRVVTDAISQNLPDMVLMLVQLVAAFAFMYWMSPVLAVCVLCIMPVFLVLSKVYMKRMRAITARVREIDGRIQAGVQEGVQHVVLIKAMRCIDAMARRLDSKQDDLYDETMRRTRFNIFSRSMVRTGFILGYLAAFLWSIWHLYEGVITFGTMTAFLQLVSRVQLPISGMARSVPLIVQATTSVDRLLSLENMGAEEASHDIHLSGPVGIKLENVTFAYDDGPAVFSDFSCDFRPGTINAVCGVTGVGKTTMVRLILALLHPQKGLVKIYSEAPEGDSEQMQGHCASGFIRGGQSFDMGPDLRCNLSYVPQGNSLLCDSVRANLQMADPQADEAAMRAALHDADADFVFDLPDGLDTLCGERGARLSEGQAQRIAIARALLGNAKVLLLDEFNSALDTRTADTIMQRMHRSHPDATIIMISHRTEVLDYCHQVIRL